MKSYVLPLFIALVIGSTAVAQPAQVHVPDAEQFVGVPRGAPVAGAPLEQRAQEISALLRCPVCQGLAIADSPSEMATNMKGQVRELLARGFTEAQILQYFERSYGQFVLLKPKFQGVGALVWIFPIAAVLIGILIIIMKARRLERVSPASVQSTQSEAPAEDEYLARVRKLVEKP